MIRYFEAAIFIHWTLDGHKKVGNNCRHEEPTLSPDYKTQKNESDWSRLLLLSSCWLPFFCIG